MIFGNIKNLHEYDYLPVDIKKCFEYAASNNLLDFVKGSYKIDGNNLFVNIVEYETIDVENRFWEAHKNYLDLHLMLDGKEQIDVNFIGNMEEKEFVEKDDFLPLEGDKNGHVILEKDDFLICYPNDAHRTAVKVNNPKKIKKAIFKIIISK